MDVLNRGEVVGRLADWIPDMWYLGGRFTSINSPAGVRFAAAASALDLRTVYDGHTHGIRALLRETPDDAGTVFIVMSLAEGRLFGRRVFEPEAVKWVAANVPE
jgi:hypothetical protein